MPAAAVLSRRVCAGAALAAAVVFASTPSAAGTARAGGEAEAVEVLVQMGRAYYANYCATCHGETARGGGPAARALRSGAPDLTRVALRRGGDFRREELATVIDGRALPAAHGSREMPIWGRIFSRELGGGEIGDEISRGRVLALVEYLGSLQRD